MSRLATIKDTSRLPGKCPDAELAPRTSPRHRGATAGPQLKTHTHTPPRGRLSKTVEHFCRAAEQISQTSLFDKSVARISIQPLHHPAELEPKAESAPVRARAPSLGILTPTNGNTSCKLAALGLDNTCRQRTHPPCELKQTQNMTSQGPPTPQRVNELVQSHFPRQASAVLCGRMRQ